MTPHQRWTLRGSALGPMACAFALAAVALGLLATHPGHAFAAANLKAKIQNSVLVVDGTDNAETIVLRRMASDASRVEVVADGASIANFGQAQFTSIKVTARGGDDVVTLDESNGPMVAADIDGGPGNDSLTGGSGNDHFNWDDGDGSDSINGAGGTDSIDVSGNNAAETFTLARDGASVRLDRVTPDPFFLEITSVENFALDAKGGDDQFSATNGIGTLIQLTVEGGSGDDTLRGGDGADTLSGDSGDDFIDGNTGADTILMGGGNDTFQWDPGDGSDIVEGQGGKDAMQFNGSNIGELIDLSANGSRLRFTRNVANIVMDVDGVETVNFRALGGADVVNVNDLSATDVNAVNVDLTGFDGLGDSAADLVVVNFTAGNDTVKPISDANGVHVSGLGAKVNVTGGDTTGTEDTVRVAGLGGDDRLVAQAENLNNSSLVIGFDGGEGTDTVEVNGTAADETFFAARNGTFARIGETAPSAFNLDVAAEQVELNAKGGNDVFNGQNGLSTVIQFTIDGGAGNDQLRGTDGADTLIGGLGDDFIDGNIGADTALMGAGNDTFQWDPGDGSDIVEGQGGLDTMQFNGSNIGEVIDLSANGQRLRFTRNVASIVMDVDGVEVVNFRALGGADAVTVHNLAATAVNGVNVDLGAFDGTGDSSADNVVVEGTDGPDVITVAGSAGSATVTGLPVKVTITAAESALDRLTVSAGNGDDVIEASGLGADSIQLTGDGGEGADVLVGGSGNDTLLGGPGDDVLEGGPGNDVLDGGTGDNVLIQ